MAVKKKPASVKYRNGTTYKDSEGKRISVWLIQGQSAAITIVRDQVVRRRRRKSEFGVRLGAA